MNYLRENRVLLYCFIFITAFVVHLIGLNLIGRTWDEEYKTLWGAQAIDNISRGDFSLASWADGADHPMVGKYIYGYAMLTQAIPLSTDGIPTSLPADTVSSLQTGNYIRTGIGNTWYAVPYDFTVPRVISALANAGTVLLTVMLAQSLLKSIWWSLLAGSFLLVTPRFLFLGQLVTFESLSMFFFCLILYFFEKLLQNPEKIQTYLIVGLLCGLFFWTRYNNILFLPVLLGWLPLHYYFHKKKNIFSPKLLLIPSIAFVFGILIWPLVWYDFPKHLIESFAFHEGRDHFSLMYWFNYLVQTPIPILFGFFIGCFYLLRKRAYHQMVFLWILFCGICLYSLLAFPEGGTRYPSNLYPILAIISAFGFANILKHHVRFLLIPLFAWMIVDQIHVFPYYIDYYNQFVGGPSGAAKRGLALSWWGEGQREVGLWINDNVPDGSTIGLRMTQGYLFPRVRRELHLLGDVLPDSDADYIAISRSQLKDFPDQFFKKYALVYAARVDGELLVGVYKRN